MQYSISQAAEKMNLSAYTLRYYDKEGLLPMVGRTPGGSRLFNEDDMGWLRLIECLKSTGMSIKDIRQYIAWYMEGDKTLKERRDMFYRQRQAVEAQMAQLQKTLNAVNFKCWFYDQAVAAGTEDAVRDLSPDQLPPDIRRLKEDSCLSSAVKA